MSVYHDSEYDLEEHLYLTRFKCLAPAFLNHTAVYLTTSKIGDRAFRAEVVGQLLLVMLDIL